VTPSSLTGKRDSLPARYRSHACIRKYRNEKNIWKIFRETIDANQIYVMLFLRSGMSRLQSISDNLNLFCFLAFGNQSVMRSSRHGINHDQFKIELMRCAD
jgi:hypothetical protein